MLLDKDDLTRAARQSFEPESSAARKQIEAAPTANSRTQPVEERLAHTARGPADFGDGREAQTPSPPGSADDAQYARMPAACRGGPCGPISRARIPASSLICARQDNSRSPCVWHLSSL